MLKFIFSFAVIFTGLLLGYASQILVRRKHIALGIPIDDFRKLLQKVALLFVNPIAIIKIAAAPTTSNHLLNAWLNFSILSNIQPVSFSHRA